MRPSSRPSPEFAASVSWGKRGRSSARAVSWTAGRMRLASGVVAALAAAVPVAGAAPAIAGPSEQVVVVGADAVAALRAAGARDLVAGELPTVATATLRSAQVARLRQRGLRVVADAPVQLTEKKNRRNADPSDRLSVREVTGADRTGRTGRGVTVAVVDSGVDEVPGLTGRVIQGPNFSRDSGGDRYGHGTFVAGLIAGDGSAADGSDTGIVGVAPGARILSVKIADRRGRSTVGRLTLGLAWVVAHEATYGIDVVNLSVAVDRQTSYDASPVNALVEAAWFSGMTVVASAGNDGQRVTSAPGNDPFVITAGSLYDRNTSHLGDDRVSSFSNWGRTLDGFDKPEVAAPGEHVQSTLPVGSDLAARQKVQGLPVGYGQMSGTSMAAGVTSGQVALLLEERPGLGPDRVKGALIASRQRGERGIRLERAFAADQNANYGLRPSIALAIAYAQLIVGTTDYASIDWNTVAWHDVAWAKAVWTDAVWTDAVWTEATWSEATWADATWAEAVWSEAVWSEATWTEAVWSEAVWSDSVASGQSFEPDAT